MCSNIELKLYELKNWFSYIDRSKKIFLSETNLTSSKQHSSNKLYRNSFLLFGLEEAEVAAEISPPGRNKKIARHLSKSATLILSVQSCCWFGSGRGTVVRSAVSKARGMQFESRHLRKKTREVMKYVRAGSGPGGQQKLHLHWHSKFESCYFLGSFL